MYQQIGSHFAVLLFGFLLLTHTNTHNHTHTYTQAAFTLIVLWCQMFLQCQSDFVDTEWIK